MMPTVVLYEHPFNERVRTYLRLERLFARLDALLLQDLPSAHHQALTTLFEILDVAARADLKGDALRDIEKQKQVLASYRGNPAISEAVLDAVIGQLDTCFKALNAQTGKAGQALSDNEFLMSVRSRAGIPGGTCEFDVPAYHDWLHRGPGLRQSHLAQWLAHLSPLSNAVNLLLKLLRESGSPQQVMALNGQFQQSLPQGKTYQLMRLRINADLDLIPEISGNRLLVSVRLVRLSDEFKLEPSATEAPLELTLCA